MVKRIFITIILATTLLIQGCSGQEKTSNPITKTHIFKEPSNEDLSKAMLDFLKKTNAPIASTYNFVRFDLNGDKMRDAILMIKSPYGYWCGKHGCVMLIMKANHNGFTLVNAIQPVREPVYISRTKINGWNNLIVRVSGRMHGETRNVALRFDGAHYPKNPTKFGEYPVNPANHPDFIRILYDDGLGAKP